jgi:membrane-bound serine protease (ClpP class)
MNPALLFALFTLLAFVLFVAEVFIPGGVIGGVGLISMLTACGFAVAAFGPAWGILVSMLMILLTLCGFMFWLMKMPDTRIGKRFALQTSLTTRNPDAAPDPLIGKQGPAETDLRPGGFARFDGKKTDVIAQQGYVEKGTMVEVIEVHGSRVVVKKV